MQINQYLQRQRFLILLLTLLFFLLLMPLLSNTELYRYVFGLSFSLVTIFCLYIIGHDKKILMIAFILACISITLNWIKTLTDIEQILLVTDYFITIAFLSLITCIALSYVIRDTVISNSTLYGSICCYLLLGLTWSYLYLLINYFNPNAFTIITHVSLTELNKLQQYIYYSYVTLTTLGYGDIVPNSNIAKTFSWLEAIVGQIYLTVLIARLVGLHIAQQDKPKKCE